VTTIPRLSRDRQFLGDRVLSHLEKGEATMSDRSETRENAHKSERIAVRLTPTAKQALERAAEVSGRSLSDFVVDSAFRAARQTIEEHERLRLTREDRKVFLAALDNPPKPNRALRAAAARYRKLTGE
jgi:uncharacterized protein (DUF1778 family)